MLATDEEGAPSLELLNCQMHSAIMAKDEEKWISREEHGTGSLGALHSCLLDMKLPNNKLLDAPADVNLDVQEIQV